MAFVTMLFIQRVGFEVREILNARDCSQHEVREQVYSIKHDAIVQNMFQTYRHSVRQP